MNKKTEKRSKLFLGLTIFGGVGFIAGISTSNIEMSIFYFAFTVSFFFLWFTRKTAITEKKTSDEADASQNSLIENAPIKPAVAKTDKNNNSTITAISNNITKRFSVAGTSYRKNEILSLASENPDYNLTKKEICELYGDGDKIYKYIFYITDVNLEPEPTNEYDPNAIKVIADNIHIGYIKKGKCSEVRNLLNSGLSLSIDIEIYGGSYKTLYFDCDEEKYSLEKEECDFGAKVSITYTK